jgi:hypothetical protein
MVMVLEGETDLIVTAELARHTPEITLCAWTPTRTGQAIELKTTF